MSLDCVRIVSFLPQLQNALCEPSLGSQGLMAKQGLGSKALPPWSTCHAMNIMCIKKDTSTCWAFEAPCSRELLGPKLIHVQYVVGRMLQANWGTCCMQKQEQTSPHHVQYKYYFQAQYLMSRKAFGEVSCSRVRPRTWKKQLFQTTSET